MNPKKQQAGSGPYGEWDAGAVRRLTLRDQVYGALLDAIGNGSLRPGAALTSTAVAAKLNVSRTPVREAIERLVQDGLAVRTESGTTRVHVPSLDDIRDFFRVREVMEGLAASLACTEATDEELDALEDNQRELRRLVESNTLTTADGLRLNRDFHEAILRMSRNRRAEDIMRTLGATLNVRILEQVYMRADPSSTLDDHQKIIDALRARDATEAERLARQHVRSAGELHLSHIGSEPATLMTADGARDE